MTGINRRQFGLLLAGMALAPRLLATGAAPQPLLASAATGSDGEHRLQLLDSDGQVLLDHPLPARAHHVAWHPQKPILAAVARRPGTYIELVDYQQGRPLKRIEPDTGRHFYGHAIFTADGLYLISTENRQSDNSGRITVRDATQGFAVVADHPSHGVGPHELALMPGTQTLVVANGGIVTEGREKLNLDNMQPSLAYIDLHSGALLEQQTLPAELHQLSIRHLDVNHAGQVIIALQYEGPRHHDVPLVALHQQGSPLQLLQAPDAVNRSMKLYCGSARFDRSGQVAAISSPRGNLITFWDSLTGKFLNECKVRDGCGLSATERDGEFLISSGSGHLYRYQVASGKWERLPQKGQALAWDNHMATRPV